mmetsp:Transcript_25755/g.53673  ORF Transcript_25755/g.53673 Transcript_25755/m.53673 type:complete len:142 (+) Transcript_25755:1072-1497(+)
MSDICDKFDLAHDVGNAIYHWMYMLPEVRLPKIPPRDVWKYGKSGRPSPLMGIHGFARPNKKKKKSRTNRNTTDIYNALGQFTYPKPPYTYKWHRPKGYMQTETYHLYGNASSWKDAWHTIPRAYCPGSVYVPWGDNSSST